ncbi:antirestriction protein ArdA [Tritonibacter mobilis]|uniref:antirestriction protein ArdA n=1 Tax=Tritonibacter mobilis TaxID=379347 RepID=UPI000806EFD9|nr:antirestriction protein ArdA [Tritonibacter mobilis]
MPQLFAQPYDMNANGFYFESIEEYTAKAQANRNIYGDPVEEYEIQFIDGDEIDCALAEAWGLYQSSISSYFRAADDWDLNEKQIFIIAVGEVGYQFDPETVSPADFDVDIYHIETMNDLAQQFVDEGLFGEIPSHLASYIDIEAIARDLAMDYTETLIAGEHLIYRAA